MTHPLMEYLPAIPPESVQALNKGNIAEAVKIAIESQRATSVAPAAPLVVAPPLNLAAANNYYGRKAYDYDLGRENSEKWKAEHAAVEAGLDGVSGKLLDIPCGTGRFFPIYREKGFEVLGMDISEDMLHQAMAKDPEAKLATCDIAKGIPLADKSADVTVCSQFLKFCTEDEMAAVIREIGRVTKSRILCSLMTGEATIRGGKRNWVHSMDAFEAACTAAGFVIKASAPINASRGHHLWMLEAA